MRSRWGTFTHVSAMFLSLQCIVSCKIDYNLLITITIRTTDVCQNQQTSIVFIVIAISKLKLSISTECFSMHCFSIYSGLEGRSKKCDRNLGSRKPKPTLYPWSILSIFTNQPTLVPEVFYRFSSTLEITRKLIFQYLYFVPTRRKSHLWSPSVFFYRQHSFTATWTNYSPWSISFNTRVLLSSPFGVKLMHILGIPPHHTSNALRRKKESLC